MSIAKETLGKYVTDVFVETGSHIGGGIQLALDVGFSEVHSIELGEHLYRQCIERFKDNPAVNLYLGDSEAFLPKIMSNLPAEKRATLWLDAHCSWGDTVGDKLPLVGEINAIGQHSRKDHFVLIDDLRDYRHGQDKDLPRGEEQLREELLKVNPEYQFKYEHGHIENDILVAYIP